MGPLNTLLLKSSTRRVIVARGKITILKKIIFRDKSLVLG